MNHIKAQKKRGGSREMKRSPKILSALFVHKGSDWLRCLLASRGLKGGSVFKGGVCVRCGPIKWKKRFIFVPHSM